VQCIELESCVINQSCDLEGEPYVYIMIDEIKGDYNINMGKHRACNVFGKLFL